MSYRIRFATNSYVAASPYGGGSKFNGFPFQNYDGAEVWDGTTYRVPELSPYGFAYWRLPKLVCTAGANLWLNKEVELKDIVKRFWGIKNYNIDVSLSFGTVLDPHSYTDNRDTEWAPTSERVLCATSARNSYHEIGLPLTSHGLSGSGGLFYIGIDNTVGQIKDAADFPGQNYNGLYAYGGSGFADGHGNVTLTHAIHHQKFIAETQHAASDSAFGGTLVTATMGDLIVTIDGVDYDVWQVGSPKISGTVIFTPIEWFEYRDSHGNPVFDTTTGAELTDPLG